MSLRDDQLVIERALAAERAATLEEVRTAVSDLMARTVGRDYKIYCPGLRDALSLLKTLPRDRSALEGATKMAAAQARHEMNQKIGERLGQDANEKSTLQMLDDALAQARRKQREKDAEISENWNSWSEKPGPTKTAQGGIAAAILAQED